MQSREPRTGADPTLFACGNDRGEVVTKVSRQMGMGRPPIGEMAMTDAEHVRRWRERHAERLAKQAPKQRLATVDDLKELIPTADD